MLDYDPRLHHNREIYTGACDYVLLLEERLNMKNRILCNLLLFIFVVMLIGCATRPPRDVNNLCSIFREHHRWRSDAFDVQRRWLVPVHVQMAIMHQESKFDANATPPRTKLLWVIPWRRPSTAYGYSQALRSTWAEYKRSSGGMWASRDDFYDAVDFMGWYANQAYLKAGISRHNAYQLYLAYHEGVGGYQRKTYLHKPWLMSVAKKVEVRAQIYQAQLRRC